MLVSEHTMDADTFPSAAPDGERADAEALRAAYEIESRRRTRRGAITYCLLAGAVVLASVPLDRMRFPSVAATLLVIRLGGAAAFAVVAAALRSQWGRRQPHILALLAPTTAGALLLALASVTGGDTSPIMVSINFVMLGAAALILWGPRWAAAACVLVIAEYVGAALAEGGPIGPDFADNMAVYIASLGIAVAMAVTFERRRARAFADQWALAAAHRGAYESAARYRSVVETAGSILIVLSADGRIVELNREAERVLGWTRVEATGRAFLDLCVPDVDRAPFEAAVSRALRGGRVRELEARMATRDGVERLLVCNASRLLGGDGQPAGVILSAQDITDRKRAEEALRESDSRLRMVVANAPVVLFTVDRAGVITFSDGRGLARLGLTPGAIVGRRLVDVTSSLGIDPTPYAGYLERALAGEEPTWVGSAVGATFETRLTPVRDAAGHVTGTIGVALDVTERTEAETTRLSLERKLLEAQKLESLGLLAGGVAHDFSNLLVSVLGNASLAMELLPADSPAGPVLHWIEKAARQGSDLARQMLAYSGRGRVVRERVDLNAIVDEMRDLLQGSLRPRATMLYELAPALPVIQADPTQMRQIVMNLVLNASEAIGPRDGGITVRTGVAAVAEGDLETAQHASDAAPGSHVYLEVADTGCGMDAATMARIFDPFFSTKVTGRGLGLATVLGAVRGHRGVLQVASEPDAGTAFRILLPCPEAASDADATASAALLGAQNEGDGRTMLLVDDDDDVRAVTAHMLERLGWSVLLARDGREGVEMFRAHAQTIDAVILDVTLPRLSGEGALREIRNIRPDARVIVMSGYNEQAVAERLGAGDLAGFLRKPFSVAELRSTVDRALTHAAPAAIP